MVWGSDDQGRCRTDGRGYDEGWGIHSEQPLMAHDPPEEPVGVPKVFSPVPSSSEKCVVYPDLSILDEIFESMITNSQPVHIVFLPFQFLDVHTTAGSTGVLHQSFKNGYDPLFRPAFMNILPDPGVNHDVHSYLIQRNIVFFLFLKSFPPLLDQFLDIQFLAVAHQTMNDVIIGLPLVSEHLQFLSGVGMYLDRCGHDIIASQVIGCI